MKYCGDKVEFLCFEYILHLYAINKKLSIIKRGILYFPHCWFPVRIFYRARKSKSEIFGFLSCFFFIFKQVKMTKETLFNSPIRVKYNTTHSKMRSP
jgi:hypothetical protein